MLRALSHPTRYRPVLARLPKHRFTSHLSTEQPPPHKSNAASTALLVGLGGGAIVASYFVWPVPSRAAPTKKNALLSPSHFTPVTITSTQSCPDPNTRLMTFTIPPNSIPSLQDAAFEPIWSVYIKDDDIQVERPFTPLEGVNSEGQMRFWVKKYDNGEVGRWLHSKKAGETIEIRGPLKTWSWRADEWDEIIMVSGGTGITPFYQLIHKELLSQSSPNTKTRFTLLHSSRRPTELPPSEILEPLISYSQAHPDRLGLSLFVDASEGPAHPAVSSSLLTVSRIGKEAIERATVLGDRSWWRGLFGASPKLASQEGGDGQKRILFLVCGPDPMLAAIAGPYGRNFSQGEIGGVLGKLGYDGKTVWKL
ncbi:hypothetical protein V8D89_005871 [Ganoderma adspersum]